jgi:hypothetical protein
MRVTFNNSRALPDDFPKFVAQHHARMPEEKRTAIADRVGLAKSFWYSTHPASGDRIRGARLMQKDGVFSLDAPATELFANFPVLSHQVSLLHYTDDLDLPLPLIQLRPTQAFFESKAPEPEPPNHAREELEKAFGPARLRLKSSFVAICWIAVLWTLFQSPCLASLFALNQFHEPPPVSQP